MIHASGLRIHPEKSYFGADSVEFLGHLVSPHGLSPEQAKVETIRQLPHPKDLQDQQSKMGQLGYYRHFIPNFSAIAYPINRLTTKGTTWHWTEEHAQAFEQLKAAITTPGLVLRAPDPTQPYRLHTDFSARGIGAVLGQLDENEREYLVACISRSLNKHEKNYDAYKGEALAATWAIRTFHIYLHGHFFYLVTDHRPLMSLMSSTTLGGHHARWALQLQPYTFAIIHRPGKTSQNADVASRYPLPTTGDPSGARLDDEDAPAAPSFVVHDYSPSPAPAVHTTSSSASQLSASFSIMGPHTALGTPQFLSINTNPLPAIQGLNMLQDPAHTPSTRITLYEPFGGMCSGLEAALLAGFQVGRYIYSDPDPAAQVVALHRLHYLHTLFPSQFHNMASRDAFSTLPHDVDTITDRHILQTFTRDPQPLLIIAGWECQDLSPAGTGTRLRGTRSSSFYSLLQLLATTQFC